MGLFDSVVSWFIDKKREHSSPYERIIRAILSKYSSVDIVEIFYIAGFEYSQKAYEEFLLAIEINSLSTFFKNHQYNAREDVVELYLIVLKSSKSDLMVLWNPIELYSNEEIIKIFNADGIALDNLSKENLL